MITVRQTVHVHRGSCILGRVRVLFRDLARAGDADDRSMPVLLRRLRHDLKLVVAGWPRERLGDVPEELLKLGDDVEELIAASRWNGPVA